MRGFDAQGMYSGRVAGIGQPMGVYKSSDGRLCVCSKLSPHINRTYKLRSTNQTMSNDLEYAFVDLKIGLTEMGTYATSGGCPPTATVGEVAEKIEDALYEVLGKLRPDNITDRWRTSEDILKKHVCSAPGSTWGIIHDVEKAVKLEAGARINPAGLVRDNNDSDDENRDNPHKWAIEVSVDSDGDPQVGYAISKGWKYPGSRGGIQTYRPRVFVHMSENEEIRELYAKYGWDSIWEGDGTLKSRSELDADMSAQDMSELSQEEDRDANMSDYSYDRSDDSDWNDARIDAKDDDFVKV